MTDSNTTIVEVNGIKLEVDLRSAKRIDTLQVGTRVKVLKKSTYSGPEVYSGVVVGFEPFRDLPTILVAYIVVGHAKAEIKTIPINSATKDWDIIPAVDDVLFDKLEALKMFDAQIAEANEKIRTLTEQRQYFERNFRQYWAKLERPEPGKVV